jgi:predicted MPP superfamily phosphohydrolase
LRFYFWSGVFITLYLALNCYIGLRGRLLLVTRLCLLNITVYWIIFALVVIASVIGIIGWKWLPDFLRSGFSVFSFYWIAVVVYFFLFILLIDLIRLIDHSIGLLRAIERRPDFTSALGLLIILFVVGLLAYGTWHARDIRVTSYQIRIPKQAGILKRLHIVMISDLHLNDIGKRRQQEIVDKVNQLQPDLVLIPGDIVLNENEATASELRKIKSKYGVFASLGNHDYSGDLTFSIKRLQQAGINVLRNSCVKVGESVYLIGRDDKTYEFMSGIKRQELADIMAGINRKLPVILLDHQPVDLEASRDAGIDLQLSGHTHRGQFFPFNLITGKIFKADYGYLKIGGLQLIVSSGAGTWGPPIRIGSFSEVVDIKVTFKAYQLPL